MAFRTSEYISCIDEAWRQPTSNFYYFIRLTTSIAVAAMIEGTLIVLKEMVSSSSIHNHEVTLISAGSPICYLQTLKDLCGQQIVYTGVRHH